ncbi:MAG TPA: nuclear transport factor 2 family protein [Telluria sp.]|nr:nuclear transport factor 2 family protein [Telluria sp.]
MRKLAVLFALSATAIAAHAATPSEVVRSFHDALARGKTDEARALLSPAVKIYESGYVEGTRDEYASHHLGADAEFAGATKVAVLRQDERVSGDMAVVTRETETRGRFKDKDVHSFGVETAVLERKGDGWNIVHFHWSSRKAK